MTRRLNVTLEIRASLLRDFAKDQEIVIDDPVMFLQAVKDQLESMEPENLKSLLAAALYDIIEFGSPLEAGIQVEE